MFLKMEHAPVWQTRAGRNIKHHIHLFFVFVSSVKTVGAFILR